MLKFLLVGTLALFVQAKTSSVDFVTDSSRSFATKTTAVDPELIEALKDSIKVFRRPMPKNFSTSVEEPEVPDFFKAALTTPKNVHEALYRWNIKNEHVHDFFESCKNFSDDAYRTKKFEHFHSEHFQP